jgi:recombination associated protein RdgC
MWFKNLAIYLLDDANTVLDTLNEDILLPQAFNPCRGLDTFRSGWASPLGRHSEQLAHHCDGRIMLCMRREDRILPAQVVREALDEKVEAIMDAEQRKVGRKEKNDLKDEIVVDLLPRAFTRSTLTYGYIDPANGWIIIDSASSNRAEEWLELLRASLGSLKVVPLTSNNAPQAVMTEWLQSAPPVDLAISDQCELQHTGAQGGTIRIRGLDLQSPEIRQHLKSDSQATKLSLEWQQRIAFILHEDLSIRRLRFLELVMDEAAETEVEDEASRFDADFALMGAELARFIPALCTSLGGVEPD